MILSQQLNTSTLKSLNQPAIHYLGKSTNFSDLRIKIARLSYLYLHELGPTKPKVAFITRNSPAVITTFFALSNIKGTCIPVNPDLPPDEIVEWVKQSHATHVAVTNDLLTSVRQILADAHIYLPLIEIEKKQGGEYDTSFSPPPDYQPVDTDIALMLRTGGTASNPKFVNLNHKQLGAAVTALKGCYKLAPNDRISTTLNWAFPFAFIHSMLFPIMNGATCVVDHGAEARDFLMHLRDAKVTRLAATPSLLRKLLVTCKNEKWTLPGLKSVIVGMGNISADVRKTFGLLKIAVAQTYGQTEACWTIAMEDLRKEVEPEAEPFCSPLPGYKYKVLDANGDQIETSEAREGLLAIMGPSVMVGYDGKAMEKETKGVLRGTWLYTGDCARLTGENEELQIQILGRRDELAWIDGTFISAAPLDSIPKKIPGIQDGACFLMKAGKTWVLGVAVIRVEGAVVNEKTVSDALVHKLPLEAKILVCFTDLIPRDSAGNVNRIKLKNIFAGSIA